MGQTLTAYSVYNRGSVRRVENSTSVRAGGDSLRGSRAVKLPHLAQISTLATRGPDSVVMEAERTDGCSVGLERLKLERTESHRD